MTNLSILDNGLRFTGENLQYAWFQLEKNGRSFFRVVALKELAVIPVDVREDYDLLGKTWAAVRGLHNAGVNFLYIASGIYKPNHIGIVQYYGAAAEADSEDHAARIAQHQVKAVEAILAGGFSQTKLSAPNLDWFKWYLEFVLTNGKFISSILGHPDPRADKRGMGADGALGDQSNADLANEQNEILFRGLSRLRENFVFQVLAEQISRGAMTAPLLAVAEAASNVASRRKSAVSLGLSLSIPLMSSLGQSSASGQSSGHGQTHSSSDGSSTGWGDSYQQNHGTADGVSHTRTISHGVGGGQTISDTTSEGHSDGKSHSVADGQSWGETNTTGHTSTRGTSTSNSVGGGTSKTTYGSLGSALNAAADLQHGQAPTGAGYGTVSISPGTQTSGHSGPQDGIAGVGINVNVIPGVLGGNSPAATDSNSTSTPLGPSIAIPFGEVNGQSSSWSQGTGTSQSSGSMSSHSSMQGGSHTVSNGTSETDTVGKAHGVSNSNTWSESESESWGTSHTVSRGEGWGTSVNQGKSHADGVAQSLTDARSLTSGLTGGMSTGLIPGISIGQSWQTEDDVAERMTEIFRQLEGVCNQASAEGGFMTNVWLFTENEAGAVAAEALVPQAFHGTNVPTPVLTRTPDEADHEQLRAHAFSFLPWTEANAADPFGGMLWTKYATLLTAEQVAAYTAPGLFEEGSASTVMAPIPKGMGFYPALPGDAVIGHQYSPETGDLTSAQVRIAFEHLMHTAFAGDTGFGKSVAAIRMCYETTLRWKLRTVVLDFGAGWRSLLNAPGLEGHVNILQLWPDAVRPMRWNPLRIGRYIAPETQWRAFADVFGSIASLGVKRQKQELLDALRKVYIGAGVLVDDPEVRNSPEWGSVRSEESGPLGAPATTPIGALSSADRQRLAVHRSSVVGLKDLYNVVQAKLIEVEKRRDTMLTGVLEGIIFRLNPLVQGTAALQFAPGPDTIPVEDFSKPWGVTIIEGGMFLDEFGKAFLLGWTGWHLYMDMVSRRVHEVNTGEPILQIFYEEANKIFVQDSGGEDSGSGGQSASQRFSDMFRDARKYLARLHVVTQAPSLIAQDIMSSCNNLIVGFLKNPRDKDMVLSAFARSEKGFRDEEWRRFVDDVPIGMAIARFPYTTLRTLQRPMLIRPLMLDVPEPTDEDIVRVLGRIKL